MRPDRSLHDSFPACLSGLLLLPFAGIVFLQPRAAVSPLLPDITINSGTKELSEEDKDSCTQGQHSQPTDARVALDIGKAGLDVWAGLDHSLMFGSGYTHSAQSYLPTGHISVLCLYFAKITE